MLLFFVEGGVYHRVVCGYSPSSLKLTKYLPFFACQGIFTVNANPASGPVHSGEHVSPVQVDETAMGENPPLKPES
jgi:hypothetical protein